MRYLLFALACRTLVACTAPPNDTGPSSLTRNVDDSGQNRWLSFDGVNDYATTATAEFPDGHAAQTICAWFKLDSIAGTQALVTVRKDFDSGLELAVADGLLSAIRVYGTPAPWPPLRNRSARAPGTLPRTLSTARAISCMSTARRPPAPPIYPTNAPPPLAGWVPWMARVICGGR
jgi:hypothetical protein